MTQTPIYEEVRRTLGRADRGTERRAFRHHVDSGTESLAQPVELRAGGGRHRRAGG